MPQPLRASSKHARAILAAPENVKGVQSAPEHADSRPSKLRAVQKHPRRRRKQAKALRTRPKPPARGRRICGRPTPSCGDLSWDLGAFGTLWYHLGSFRTDPGLRRRLRRAFFAHFPVLKTCGEPQLTLANWGPRGGISYANAYRCSPLAGGPTGRRCTCRRRALDHRPATTPPAQAPVSDERWRT